MQWLRIGSASDYITCCIYFGAQLAAEAAAGEAGLNDGGNNNNPNYICNG